LARNWRTKVCEIDIVANKNKIIYFVEVKYRSSDKQGSGFEYITPKKLSQMGFAAEIWVQQNNWNGDYRIAAAELSEEAGSIKIVELS
jgi:Holliday junction resolvase-like predicted endonuclease